MWRDVSDEIELEAGPFPLPSKIIHDSQVVGNVSYGYISVCRPRYRVRMERGEDSEGSWNKFYIEKDFEAYEIQELVIANGNEKAARPLIVVRRVKFLDVTTPHGELYINAESIVVIKRLMANRCQVVLTTGTQMELEYDAKRIKQKLEELEPDAVKSV